MGLGSLVRTRTAPVEVRDATTNFNGYLELVEFAFNGHQYVGGSRNMASRMAANSYELNGPIGALIAVRALVFGEVSFKFENLTSRDLFGSPELAVLESPWPGGTTRSLLNVLEIDGSLAGNCYMVREQGAFLNQPVLTRLDPLKTSILTAGIADAGVTYGQRLVGYSYQEKPNGDSVIFLPEEVAHYKPLPSSDMPQFRGKSWLTNVISDVNADQDMTEFKRTFLKNAVTPSMVFSFDAGVSDQAMKSAVQAIKEGKAGATHAGEALFLGAGVDPKVLGTDTATLEIAETQAAGESRLAAAAGVPVTIVGFSEGLKGSTLNAGNYASVRRRFADGTMHPLWHEAAGALSAVVKVPAQARLWYDTRGVSFLQEDVLDEAEIKMKAASTMQILVNTGYEPVAVAKALGMWPDLAHTGLNSVQLQPPGANDPAPTGGSNGNG